MLASYLLFCNENSNFYNGVLSRIIKCQPCCLLKKFSGSALKFNNTGNTKEKYPFISREISVNKECLTLLITEKCQRGEVGNIVLRFICYSGENRVLLLLSMQKNNHKMHPLCTSKNSPYHLGYQHFFFIL